MQQFGEYITGRTETVSAKGLAALIERYPWFTSARRARALLSDDGSQVKTKTGRVGQNDPALILPLMFWPTIAPRRHETPAYVATAPNEQADLTATSVLTPASPDLEAKANPASDDLIDRFLQHGDYKITPGEDAAEIPTPDNFDPTLATPELAEIYRAQGLTEEAEKIYHALSLRNS